MGPPPCLLPRCGDKRRDGYDGRNGDRQMHAAPSHKTKLIRDWFAKRPNWHVHFTPTSALWLNQVERFFALLTERALKRGVFRSVADLEAAIKAYIEATNADPKFFRWTKTPMTFSQASNASATRRNGIE